jgi:hypothetical protein
VTETCATNGNKPFHQSIFANLTPENANEEDLGPGGWCRVGSRWSIKRLHGGSVRQEKQQRNEDASGDMNKTGEKRRGRSGRYRDSLDLGGGAVG